MTKLIQAFLYGSWGVTIMYQIAYWIKWALKL
jgi:hypothetical protein